MALWRAEHLSEAVLRVAQCALEVQAKPHNYPAVEGVRLSMRLGIGASELAVAHIGGVFGWWALFCQGQWAMTSQWEYEQSPASAGNF